MSKASEFHALHCRAVRPDFLCWVICYTSPLLAGLHLATICSPNRREVVEGEFLNDFYDLRPCIQWLDCFGGEGERRSVLVHDGA